MKFSGHTVYLPWGAPVGEKTNREAQEHCGASVSQGVKAILSYQSGFLSCGLRNAALMFRFHPPTILRATLTSVEGNIQITADLRRGTVWTNFCSGSVTTFRDDVAPTATSKENSALAKEIEAAYDSRTYRGIIYSSAEEAQQARIQDHASPLGRSRKKG